MSKEGDSWPRKPKVGDLMLIKIGVDIKLDVITLADIGQLKIIYVYECPSCEVCDRRNDNCAIVTFELPLGHNMHGSKWCAHEDFFKLVPQDDPTKLSTIDLSAPRGKSKEELIVYDGEVYEKEEDRKINKRLEDLIL